MFNKIYILNSKQRAIPANILLSGLDILRRVIQLTYSFICFKEPFDAIIGVSLVFLGMSGGLLLFQYIRDYRLGVNELPGPSLMTVMEEEEEAEEESNDV